MKYLDLNLNIFCHGADFTVKQIYIEMNSYGLYSNYTNYNFYNNSQLNSLINNLHYHGNLLIFQDSLFNVRAFSQSDTRNNFTKLTNISLNLTNGSILLDLVNFNNVSYYLITNN